MEQPKGPLDCLDCDGQGHIDCKTCQSCQGAGDAPEGVMDVYCEPCRGDGRKYGEPCPACEGTGFNRERLEEYRRALAKRVAAWQQ
ncbi:hypothetical protein ABZ404_37025 [Streptomyces sp. NPDC005878]|uniref:hypothetical protein n=1 Tax=Streptomyces sp. NPDC005878 TaxID=3157077 RepID=UPI0033C8B2F8